MAKAVKIIPRLTPLPFEREDAVLPEGRQRLEIAARTLEVQERLGKRVATIIERSVDPEELQSVRALLKGAKKQEKTSEAAALAASLFLQTYAQNYALDVVAVRSALTNKLLEIANCGDRRHELRAIELLGKHVDIGLFSEKSEVTINYKTPEALEEAIRARVKRLLINNTVDADFSRIEIPTRESIANVRNDGESHANSAGSEDYSVEHGPDDEPDGGHAG